MYILIVDCCLKCRCSSICLSCLTPGHLFMHFDWLWEIKRVAGKHCCNLATLAFVFLLCSRPSRWHRCHSAMWWVSFTNVDVCFLTTRAESRFSFHFESWSGRNICRSDSTGRRREQTRNGLNGAPIHHRALSTPPTPPPRHTYIKL